MNLRQYLMSRKVPDSLFRFMDFSQSLKSEFKTLDGYAFDFDATINSVKLYYKIYNQQEIFNSNFFLWFTQNNLLSYNLKQHYHPASKNTNALSGLNLAIKYNFYTKQLVQSIYFSDKKNSSFVIHNSNNKIFYNKYYYTYNSLLIKFINKFFDLKMPKHKEGIELSFRDKEAHCTVFPNINHKKFNIKESQTYCQNASNKLLLSDSHIGQNPAICVHMETNNSSLITKGYTSKDQFQKIYFGCFDWKKSVF